MGLLPTRKKKSAFSLVMMSLLLLNTTATVYLTAAALTPPVLWCFCPLHEQLNIAGATINNTDNSATFGIINSGTTDVILASVFVTGGSYNNQAGTLFTAPASSSYAISSVCMVSGGQAIIPKNSSCTFAATFAGGSGAFVAGTTYSFKAVDTMGNAFPYTTTA